MPGGFHGTEIFTITKYRPLSVMIRILAALGLALIVVGANQMPLADSASDNSTEVSFELQVNPAHPAPICLHHSQKFYIFLTRHLSLPQYGIPDLPLEISGVVVRGSVSDTNIGILLPSDTSASYELNDLSVGAADFAFIAKKVGSTILKFDAEVGNYWDGNGDAHSVSNPYPVHVEVPVKVIACKFKVMAASNWSASYPGLTSNLVANLMGTMTADEQGHFTGTANVTWSMASFSPMCSHQHTFSPGMAHLTGDLSDDGNKLSVLIIQDPVTANAVNCASTNTAQVQAPSLETAVPASGGTLTYAQPIVVGAMDFNGLTVIAAIPETSEAAAFKPDNQAALFSPSAWWVRLWDDFPWQDKALLALR